MLHSSSGTVGFFAAKDLGIIQTDSVPKGTPNTGGLG